MKIPLITEIHEAIQDSIDCLKKEINDVKSGGVEKENGVNGVLREIILFTFRGDKYKGFLKGRNLNLCLGFGDLQDRAIAARVLLDNDCEKIIDSPS